MTHPTPQIFGTSKFQVHLRKEWAHTWLLAPHLQPLRITSAIAPDVSTAELVLRYGDIKREDKDKFALEGPMADPKNWFIRIQVENQKPPKTKSIIQLVGHGVFDDWITIFYGWVQQELIRPWGFSTDVALRSGDEVLICYGLESLLDRWPLAETYAENAAGNAAVLIDQSQVFNRRHSRGLTDLGNRSTNKYASQADAAKTTFVFSRAGDTWTARDIIEYLLLTNVAEGAKYQLGDPVIGSQDSVLASYTPQGFSAEGMTMARVLNALVNRKRGLGWCIRVDEKSQPADDVAVVHVFTVFDEDVTVGSTTIPKNTKPVTLDIDAREDIEDPVFTLDALRQVEWVMVRGARVKSMFTVQTLASVNELEDNWTAAEKTTYDAATDDDRLRDENNHVYTEYRMKKDWDWKVHPNATDYPAVPKIKLDGTIDHATLANVKNFDHHFRGDLVVKQTRLATNGEYEFQPMFVVVKSGSSYHLSDQPILTDNGDTFMVGVRPLQHEMGVKVMVGNKLPHAMSLGNEKSGGWTDSKTQAVFNYKEIYVTVCVETDEHCHVYVAINTAADATKPTGRILVINVPDAELWYRVRETVTGVDGAGALVRSTTSTSASNTVMRDDTARLTQIAALARAWYEKVRQSVKFRGVGIWTAILPGFHLKVTTESFDRESVGSVVNAVEWDCERMRTTITTGYEDPQFGAFF